MIDPASFLYRFNPPVPTQRSRLELFLDLFRPSYLGPIFRLTSSSDILSFSFVSFLSFSFPSLLKEDIRSLKHFQQPGLKVKTQRRPAPKKLT